MKLFTRTKFIGPIGLIMATAGGGTAIAAEPSDSAGEQEQASNEAPAPSQCPGLDDSESQGEATLEGKAEEAQHDPSGAARDHRLRAPEGLPERRTA